MYSLVKKAKRNYKRKRRQSVAPEEHFQTYLDNINNVLEKTQRNEEENSKRSDKVKINKPLKRLLKDSATSGNSELESFDDESKIFINSPIEFIPKHRAKLETSCSIMSSIYCTSTNNILYNITFITKNAKLYPLYLEKREVPEKRNEKESQSLKGHYYKEIHFKSSNRFWMLRRFFHFPMKLKNQFFCDFGKTTPIKVYCGFKEEHKKLKEGQSITKHSKDNGYIHLLWDNTHYKIKCKAFHLETIRSTLKFYKKGTENEVCIYNVASVITRHKNDILQFKFEMQMINIQEIRTVTTRGTQYKDNYAFVPYNSLINHRRLVIALPLSHYCYKNPMIEIFRKNRNLTLKNCEPKWLTEARHKTEKRLQEEDFNAIMKNIIDISHGSIFIVELGGDVYKFRTELLSQLEFNSTETYEAFVIERQRYENEQLQPKPRHMEIPIVIQDWNLNEYDY